MFAKRKENSNLEHYKKNYSKSKKKRILEKIFILAKKNSYYSLPLWKIPKVTFPLTKEPPWFQQNFSLILQTEKCFKIVRSIRSFNFQGSIWNSTEVEPRDRAKFWKKIYEKIEFIACSEESFEI